MKTKKVKKLVDGLFAGSVSFEEIDALIISGQLKESDLHYIESAYEFLGHKVSHENDDAWRNEARYAVNHLKKVIGELKSISVPDKGVDELIKQRETNMDDILLAYQLYYELPYNERIAFMARRTKAKYPGFNDDMIDMYVNLWEDAVRTQLDCDTVIKAMENGAFSSEANKDQSKAKYIQLTIFK